MVLTSAPPPTRAAPETILTHARVQALLDAYEKRNASRRVSRCVGLFPVEKGLLIFVKRQDEPSFHFDEKGNRAGFTPEWIVLDFDLDLRCLRVASRSPNVPVHIASELASACFGVAVTYDNEDSAADEDAVRAFLKTMIDAADPDLDLVEVRVTNSGLPGKVKVTITDPEPIIEAVKAFGAQWGDVFRDLESVEAIKVRFSKKRVTIIFARNDDGRYGVQYSDSRMNLFERRQFERHMRDLHGLPARSTEKRYADAA